MGVFRIFKDEAFFCGTIPCGNDFYTEAKELVTKYVNTKEKKALAETTVLYVEQVFKDTTYKKNAKIISQGFKNSSGAKGAADKIINVCNV